MSLKERLYSVLVVTAAENVDSALISMLPESDYYPVKTVSSVSVAKRVLSECVFDFVIINSPLPGDIGVRFAIDACTKDGAVVLILVGSDIHSDIHNKVSEHGVFTLSKPTSKPTFAMALGWMESARERLRKFEKQTLSIEKKMEEIRLVNRAKWILISELKMDEPSAHRYIEKKAMDGCVAKREVAEKIINMYS